MSTATVRISVIDGVASVTQVPRGTVVQIVDYDVDQHSAERDAAGRPCSRYSVTATDLEAWAETARLARKYPGDAPLPATPLVFKRRQQRAKAQGHTAAELFERGRRILAEGREQ
jgi:hypothetical protein